MGDPTLLRVWPVCFYIISIIMRIKTKRKEFVTTQTFSNVFCFIDDLATINDGGEFEKDLNEICLPELNLEKEKHITFRNIAFRSEYQHFE